jgi:hypothetical protein
MEEIFLTFSVKKLENLKENMIILNTFINLELFYCRNPMSKCNVEIRCSNPL